VGWLSAGRSVFAVASAVAGSVGVMALGGGIGAVAGVSIDGDGDGEGDCDGDCATGWLEAPRGFATSAGFSRCVANPMTISNATPKAPPVSHLIRVRAAARLLPISPRRGATARGGRDDTLRT
jgi:hypothetical protein